VSSLCFQMQLARLHHGRKDITVLMLSSRVISMVHLLEAHYRTRLCRQGYGPYPGGQTPSSGLLAVYIMMQVCRKVTGYGFGGTAHFASS
jgi:hypothetical protein